VRVTKRDNKTIEPFNQKEIRKALLLAFSAIGNVPNTAPIESAVVRHLHTMGRELVTVDDVLDSMEHVLMASGYHDVAKRFIIYREGRNKARAERLAPDPLAISNYTHVSRYAKYQPDLGRREVYWETVERDEIMHINRYPEHTSMIERAFKAVHEKKVLPSMRSMQFGGIAIEKNNPRMYNCCFTHINRTDVFSKIFYLLLCGCGVGYSVQEQHVEMLPRLKTIDKRKVTHHVVKDSIEGWADAIEMLMWSYFYGGDWVEFAYHEIRDEGTPLKTSGGKAPGHLGLRKAIEAIRKILDKAQGRKLRPLDCHDILCHLSIAVLSGGIRRSAMISLFSPSDTEMIFCKAKGNYDPGKGINDQRQMANNSAVFLRGSVKEHEFRRIIRVAEENYGDPGFLFVTNLDYGCNPCGEIGLYPVLWEECDKCSGAGDLGEYPTPNDEPGYKLQCSECLGSKGKKQYGFAFCNLTEINCSMFTSAQDFYTAAENAAIIGTLQASYTDFPYLGRVSEEIARRDALLGVSLTGVMDCPDIALRPDFQACAATVVNDTNARVAEMLGINIAARTTTVKPSGTASLELGCVGSGIHPHHASRHLRRVTGNINEPPVQEFMRVNPHMVEKKPNGDVALVFPVQAPAGAVCIQDMSALEFCEQVMSTYDNWGKPGTVRTEDRRGLTHNVSCTVTLMPGEKDGVIDYVWENRERIAAMSFVPGGLDKLYPFAPREAIVTEEDEAYWNRLIKGYKTIDWKQFKEEEDNTARQMAPACSAGGCEE